MKGKVSYKVDDQNLSSEVFLQLVQRVWPGKYHAEMTEEAIKKTIKVTAWKDAKLIGCVRILTDDTNSERLRKFWCYRNLEIMKLVTD